MSAQSCSPPGPRRVSASDGDEAAGEPFGRAEAVARRADTQDERVRGADHSIRHAGRGPSSAASCSRSDGGLRAKVDRGQRLPSSRDGQPRRPRRSACVRVVLDLGDHPEPRVREPAFSVSKRSPTSRAAPPAVPPRSVVGRLDGFVTRGGQPRRGAEEREPFPPRRQAQRVALHAHEAARLAAEPERAVARRQDSGCSSTRRGPPVDLATPAVTGGAVLRRHRGSRARPSRCRGRCSGRPVAVGEGAHRGVREVEWMRRAAPSRQWPPPTRGRRRASRPRAPTTSLASRSCWLAGERC